MTKPIEGESAATLTDIDNADLDLAFVGGKLGVARELVGRIGPVDQSYLLAGLEPPEQTIEIFIPLDDIKVVGGRIRFPRLA